MRWIAEKWFLGPLVALVAVYCVWIFGSLWAQSRAQDLQKARIGQVYRLSAAGNYAEILRLGLMDQESVEFLKREERLFGPIKGYEIGVGTRWRPASISVVRELARTHESIFEERRPMTFTDETLGRPPGLAVTGPEIDAARARAIWKKMVHEGTSASGGEATGQKGRRCLGDFLSSQAGIPVAREAGCWSFRLAETFCRMWSRGRSYLGPRAVEGSCATFRVRGTREPSSHRRRKRGPSTTLPSL